MKLFLTLILFLIPHIATAKVIGVVNYEYEYDVAKGTKESTFVICDCITPPLILASKESQLPQKSNALLTTLAIKAPEVSDNESTVEDSKVAIEDNDNQSGVALGTIFFAFDSAKLTKNAISKIDKIVSLIKSKGLRNITVNGYTCDIGSKEYNDNLAQKRADAVTSYLKLKGVDVSISKGEGKCCYISSLRKENRRVEIVGYMSEKKQINGGK